MSPCPLRLHREGAFSCGPQEKRTRIALRNMGIATIDARTVARIKVGCIMFFVDGMKPDGRKNKDTMTAIHTYTVVASCNGVVVYTWNCTSHKEAQGIVNYVTAQRKWNHLDRVTVKEA